MYFANVKSNKGFSLLEVVIAIGVVGAAAYLVPQFLALYNPRPMTVQRTCESYAQSIVAVVQEETPYRDLVQWIDSPARRSSSSVPTFTATRAVPAASDYWLPAIDLLVTQSPVAGSNAAGTRLQNAALIQGTLRTLATIYNRNPDIQCNFNTYDPLTSLPRPEVMQPYLTGVTNPVLINIEPYSISTNNNLCTTSLKLPIPPSKTLSNTINSFSAGSGNTDVSSIEASLYSSAPSTYAEASGNTLRIANVSNGSQDLGFRLKVRVSYQVDGITKSCEVSQNFQYAPDNTAPPPPNDVVIENNASLNPQSNCVSPTAQNVRLRIGYSGAAPERGTVLLCRDLSYIQSRRPNYSTTPFDNPVSPATTSTTTHYSGACINQSGLSSPPTSLNGLSPFPRQLGTTAYAVNDVVPISSRYWDQAHRDFSARENYWKPCDELKVCGITASSVTLNANQYSMVLSYANIPVGCFLNFEVVGVDSAGNRSNASSPSVRAMGTSPISALEEGTIVFPPTCGNSTSCGAGGCSSKASYSQYYFGAASNQGYYVPRRGVFCKPTRNAANDGHLSAIQAEPNATLHWSTNTTGPNWRTIFPNGYYTCRGAFGGTGGAGGSGSNGCCWDRPGFTTCTPYN